MNKSIEISATTYSRLEALAEGFDTPESVIIRLLDKMDGNTDTKPTLAFYPSDEQQFKLRLIETKEAEVVIYKVDGSREISRWKANRLSESSNLRGNLWSGFLRGWRGKGIKSVELTILPKALNVPNDDIAQRKALALSLGLTYDEICGLDYEVSENTGDDGLLYNYIIQFSEDCNRDTLAKIDGLDENLSISVDSATFQN
ncbi:hypothetical protein [Neptunomonas qingdaonensis]|uniref:Uncharacterized protein n=1 Tax=Neptunomonas qingdaonensis TaxID=1045558 RepID=A0A1I2UK12_9GAMM|nr:hypothetical protein [Neptunomonas qingdaonensis]SFG77370.1 hypothetical protein SAMN05216175_11367 [Neptunomonas qingdaonensis]